MFGPLGVITYIAATLVLGPFAFSALVNLVGVALSIVAGGVSAAGPTI